MVVLDADSLMSGSTLTKLVETMETNPGVGLIQTVPAAIHRRTLFGRIQQFDVARTGPGPVHIRAVLAAKGKQITETWLDVFPLR